jgi:uncharacterized RDD family membrane protein YckC
VNETSTAFQRIGTDRYLQDHWLRRLIAGIIDNIIMWIATQIIALFIALPVLLQGGLFNLTSFDLLQGLLFFLYAAFLESIWGSTIGKQVMNLKVTTTDGRLPTIDRTLIRDASKIHGLLWLIDTVVGMATVGDAHQKISDRFAGTTVVSTIQRCMILPSSPPP